MKQRVYFEHWRYVDGATDKYPLRYTKGETEWMPACRGGKTVAHVVAEDGTEVIGEALCSLKDNFVYQIGRDIALGRALKKLSAA